MALPRVPAALQKKWEAILKAEGLEPLDTPKAEGKYRQQNHYLRGLSPDEREARSAYYSRCLRQLERVRIAFHVWSLHCTGMGRRAIAEHLGLSEKTVRLSLLKVQDSAGIVPASWGGDGAD